MSNSGGSSGGGASTPFANFLAADSALAESVYRQNVGNSSVPLTASQLALVGVSLYAGQKVHRLGAVSTRASAGQAHGWFALFNSALALQALSVDLGAAQWAALTPYAGNIATIASGASSEFDVTVSGLYYVGIFSDAATTTPSIVAAATFSAGFGAMVPNEALAADTLAGQPAFPFTATKSANLTNVIYAYAA